MKRSLRILVALIPALVMMVFGYYLMGGNLSAELGMIDDHEIMMFLGEDGKITPSEIPEILMTTEVGEYGEALRYRPAYYTLRIVESMIWQDNAQLWYGVRYLIFVYSFYLLWKILSLFFPRIISYLFVFYALTMPFWPDLLTRLGPSEIYTVPAIMLFTWGLIKILRDEESGKEWLQLTLGYVICIGSKENFLFLLPIIIGLIGCRMMSNKVRKGELLYYLAMLGFTGYVGSAVVTATMSAGADIYATKISYPERVVELLRNFPNIVRLRHIELVVVSALGYGVWQLRKLTRNKTILMHLGVIIALLLIAASQYILYNNTLPTNSRYDFPALLLFPIMNLVAVRMILESIKNKRVLPIAKIVAYGGLTTFMLYYILTRQHTLIHLQSRKNAVLTAEFSRKIELVREKMMDNPESTLVYASYKYIDFEPVISISRYLEAKGVENRMTISYVPEKLESSDMLGRELQDRMGRASTQGEESEELFSRFSPITELEDGGQCYSISFGRERESGYGCELITFF